VPAKYVSVQGIATYLRHTGSTTLPQVPPDLSAGEALICIHHTGGNCRNFDPLLEALYPRHSGVACDLPGHDRTSSLESLGSIEAMADFIAALVDTLAVGRPVVLLGHGMGGSVALQCALAHPKIVRALVVCGSGVDYACGDDLIDRARLVCEGKARREFEMAAFKKGVAPEIMRAGYMDTLKTDPRVIYPNLMAQRDWHAAERLAEIDVPTLVCVGDEEQSRVTREADRLVATISGARKAEVPEAGHMLPTEKPEALASVVDEFLGELA